MAKKEGSNNLLTIVIIVLVAYFLLNGSITGNAFKLGKDITRYLPQGQQKTATLTTPKVIAEKICTSNSDCSAGYSCKPVTKYTCQKDATTITTPVPTPTPTATVPSCTDKIKNQDETDIDCGGSICAVCANGKVCNNLNSNCVSKYCNPSSNKCEVYIPKLILKASTTATGNCPTGTAHPLTRATKYLFVSKIPNPTSLSDFTQVYSGTNGWLHFCVSDRVTIYPAYSSAQYCGNQLPCCTTTVQAEPYKAGMGYGFLGSAAQGYYDGRSATVITSSLPNGKTATEPYCSRNLIAIDITTDNKVDASKLACPSGYSSAGIISEDTSVGLMYTHFCVQ